MKERKMDLRFFVQWLESMSVLHRIRALTLIYSALTVGTRQLFLPDMPKGKEQTILNMLHGINELHHTLANWLLSYATDESKAFSVETLGRQLMQISNQYQIDGLLNSAIEFAQTRNLPDSLN